MTRTPDEIKKGLECGRANANTRDCKGCPYCDDRLLWHCQLNLMADALALIQQLEAQVPRWIPVEERLPNSYCGVLCTDGERVFRAAYLTGSAYIPDHWAEIMDDRTGHIVTTQKMSDPPSHWMPLPEPPKEE